MNHEPPRDDEDDVEPNVGEFQPDDEILSTPSVRVTRMLGRGGHATTYAGTTTEIGKPVAIKLLHPHLSERGDHVQRLREEARKLAQLSHPNIVEVYSAGVTSGPRPQAYILMQLLSGKSLRTLPRHNNRLSPKTVVDILAQICSALAAAHAKGIIHQDLKLENVVLHKDPHSPDILMMKVIDFGVSRFVSEEPKDGVFTFEGTPKICAPEQLSQAEPVTFKVDLYALGMMGFELLTGRRPYHDAELRDWEQDEIDRLTGKTRDFFATYVISDKLTKDAPLLSVVLEDVFREEAEKRARQKIEREAQERETGIKQPVPREDKYPQIPKRLEDLIASLLARRSADRPETAEALKTLQSLGKSLEKQASHETTQDALLRSEEPNPPPEDIPAKALRGGQSIRIELAKLPNVASPVAAARAPSPLESLDRNATLEMPPVGQDGQHTVRLAAFSQRPSESTSEPPPPAAVVAPPREAPRPSIPPPVEIRNSGMLHTREVRLPASPVAQLATEGDAPWTEDERAKFERIPPLDLAFDLFFKQAPDLYVAKHTGIPLERVRFLGAWFRQIARQWHEVQTMWRKQDGPESEEKYLEFLVKLRRSTPARDFACALLGATDAAVEGIADVANMPLEETVELSEWVAYVFNRRDRYEALSLDEVVAQYREPRTNASPARAEATSPREAPDASHVDDLLHSYAGPAHPQATVRPNSTPSPRAASEPQRNAPPRAHAPETSPVAPPDPYEDRVELPQSGLNAVWSWPVWKLTALFSLTISIPMLGGLRWWMSQPVARAAAPVVAPLASPVEPTSPPLQPTPPVPAPTVAVETPPAAPNGETAATVQVAQKPTKSTSPARKASPSPASAMTAPRFTVPVDLFDDAPVATPPKAPKASPASVAVPSMEDKLYGLIVHKKDAHGASDAGADSIGPGF